MATGIEGSRRSKDRDPEINQKTVDKNILIAARRTMLWSSLRPTYSKDVVSDEQLFIKYQGQFERAIGELD